MVSPLAAVPDTVRLDPDGVTVRVRVEADEPCLAGHYPGFPILPGVLLVDLVDGAVRRHAATHGTGPVELAEVRSVRFSRPVLPGDEVTADCAVTATDGGLAVAARCTTAQGKAATLKLRYRRSPR